MSADAVHIRRDGRAGRITLQRPEALNALTHAMIRTIEAAIDAWRDDGGVALIVIDAKGDKAFCAGGDIQALYHAGKSGDFASAQRFWADEYRLNAKLHDYPKPIVALMQGFVMGGGVGLGCHASHRIIAPDTTVAMPECGIGLVPDVGGSLILARAPGRLGEYLALTGARVSGADAAYAGFADAVVEREKWPDLMTRLTEAADLSCIAAAAIRPAAPIAAQAALIDRHFAAGTVPDILHSLESAAPDENDLASAALKMMRRNAPLSMACALEILHRLRRDGADIARALDLEYRFTFRALEHSDFIEGVRAQVIDKDRTPIWRHTPATLPDSAVADMLAPLGADRLSLQEKG